MQKITDELIERFLKGECTQEESVAISAYFENHPEDNRLLDEFIMTDGSCGLPMGYSRDMLAFIMDATVEEGLILGAGTGASGIDEGGIDGHGIGRFEIGGVEIAGVEIADAENGGVGIGGTENGGVGEPGVTGPGFAGVGIGGLGIGESGVEEPGVAEVGFARVVVAEVGVDEPGVAEVKIGEVEITESNEWGYADGYAEGYADGYEVRGARVRRLRRWAVAAAIIVGVCAVYMLKMGKRDGKKGIQDGQVAEVAWLDKVNEGKREMAMSLPDGSALRLMPGARIRYRKDFLGGDRREVMMSGVVRFDIAKNEHKPFVVSSGGLNTNVLGTNFEVSALPAGDRIKVRLYGGKVMVSLDTLVAGNERKDYYLVPGQEIIYNKNSRNVAINEFGKKREAEEDLVTTSGKAIKTDSVANWYMFNNQTLGEVFEQLSVIYNVQIQYSRRDISKLYFIGKLEKKDSLHKIIQDIALLNHLKVKTEDGTYIITKKP